MMTGGFRLFYQGKYFMDFSLGVGVEICEQRFCVLW